MTKRLEFGDSIAGLLIDGVAETPFAGATLRMRDPEGIRVEVPFVSRDEAGQFAHVDRWFREMRPPENLLLATDVGSFSFYENKWSGHSHGAGLSHGAFRPTETVFAARDGDLNDPLEIDVLRSRLDGLNRWSGVQAVSSSHETDKDGRIMGLTVDARGDVSHEWAQGEAVLRVSAHWGSEFVEDGYHRSVVISDNVVLESQFSTPRPFLDHLVEQRKVANLIALLFGHPIAFRKHEIRHPRFVTRVLSGEVVETPFVELVSSRTVGERTLPVPTRSELQTSIAYLTHVGTNGLEEWAKNYDKWRRFILPSTSAQVRGKAHLEDIVASTSMAIEAAGSLIGERAGEAMTHGRGRPSTATFVYRCLDLLGLEWAEHIPGNVALARAIADNYNTVKHFNRGDLPNREETYLIAELNRWIVRLVALTLTGKGDELLQEYRVSDKLWRIKQMFDAYGLRLDEGGRWVGLRETVD